jgi:putative ABC transport system ATP-binding protein
MSDADGANGALIEVREAAKAYEGGRIRALNGMDLTVREGEFVAIVGPSGCGKSTLLHLLAALDRPDTGSIRVAGHDLSREGDLSHYRARHIGMVFQLHNLLPTLTAAENVQVPMFELGLRTRERRARAAELLRLVGLAERATNRPAELSGGERQRVAIARALANEPAILLADEPTGSLDSKAGRQILELIEELRIVRGMTIVMVTHDLGIASRADRVVRMLDGALAPAEPSESEAGDGAGDDLLGDRERGGRAGGRGVPDVQDAVVGLEHEVLDERAVGRERLRADA